MDKEQQLLQNILDRITANDIEVQILEEERAALSPVDLKMKNELREMIRKVNSDSTKLLGLYHSISQDVNVKNAKVRAEVQLVLESVKTIASKTEGENNAKKIVRFIDMFSKGVDINGNKEESKEN